MLKVATRLALVLVVLVAALLVVAGPAAAQMREFTGRVDKINDEKFILDNRKGDKVTFRRIDTTEVSGQGKTSWDDLEKGDWLIASWKFVDKPRKVYKVVVIPSREEDD